MCCQQNSESLRGMYHHHCSQQSAWKSFPGKEGLSQTGWLLINGMVCLWDRSYVEIFRIATSGNCGLFLKE